MQADGLADLAADGQTGLSEVIGSWKIIDDLVAAHRAHLRLGEPQQVAAVEQDLPPTMRPGGSGTRRMMESAVMLLPQPDSPTMASVSPASSAKDTSSTAFTGPRRVASCVLSPLDTARMLRS